MRKPTFDYAARSNLAESFTGFGVLVVTDDAGPTSAAEDSRAHYDLAEVESRLSDAMAGWSAHEPARV
jgi:hypothetical protein